MAAAIAWVFSAPGRSARRWAILILVACAFLVRFWGVTRLHYWDENVYLLNAEYFYSGHAGFTEIDYRPPLLSVLFAAAFHAWHSDYAAEVLAALLNAMGPLFMFLAGRRIVGRQAAAVAAAAACFSSVPGRSLYRQRGRPAE